MELNIECVWKTSSLDNAEFQKPIFLALSPFIILSLRNHSNRRIQQAYDLRQINVQCFARILSANCLMLIESFINLAWGE